MKSVAYLRRSTDMQDQSLDDQLAVINAYADREGHEIIRIFTDDAISGTTSEKRPAFQEMTALAQQPGCGFEAILVYDVSRFGRFDPDEAGHWRYLLRQNGVQIIYVADNLNGDETDDIILPIKQYQAEEYSRKLARDTLRGLRSRASKGCDAGRPVPYGYDKMIVDASGEVVCIVRTLADGDKNVYDGSRKPPKRLAPGQRHAKQHDETATLVPGDPERVAVVRRIFDLYANEDRGQRTITDILNAQGVPGPRGGAWAVSTVMHIIKNPVYYGAMVWNRRSMGKFFESGADGARKRLRSENGSVKHLPKEDWVIVEPPDSRIEGLVSKELWLEAQRKREHRHAERRYNGQGRRSDYLLSGLIRCEHCGHPFTGHRTTSSKGNVTFSYACGGYHSRGRSVCEPHSVRCELLDDYVIDEIERRLKASLGRDKLRREVRRQLAPLLRIDNGAARIEAEIKSMGAKIDLILRGLSAENVSLADQELTRLRRQRDAAVEALDELRRRLGQPLNLEQAVDEVMTGLDELREAISDGAPAQRKQLVRVFVGEIRIDPYKKEALVGFHPLRNGLPTKALAELPHKPTRRMVAGAGFLAIHAMLQHWLTRRWVLPRRGRRLPWR